MPEENIIKRAFDLAPQCGSVQEVRRKLLHEGYSQVEAHLAGAQIKAELKLRLNPEMHAAHARLRTMAQSTST